MKRINFITYYSFQVRFYLLSLHASIISLFLSLKTSAFSPLLSHHPSPQQDPLLTFLSLNFYFSLHPDKAFTLNSLVLSLLSHLCFPSTSSTPNPSLSKSFFLSSSLFPLLLSIPQLFLVFSCIQQPHSNSLSVYVFLFPRRHLRDLRNFAKHFETCLSGRPSHLFFLPAFFFGFFLLFSLCVTKMSLYLTRPY